MMELGIFKLHEDVTFPVYGTLKSACFDFRAFLNHVDKVVSFNDKNERVDINISFSVSVDGVKNFFIPPKHRVLVPTGIKLRIPQNHYLKLYPRSGLSVKNGLTLINATGIIDEDYREELFVPLINVSNKHFLLTHGDRICQGELVETSKVRFYPVFAEPEKTTRDSGFGSTGVQ